jgi:hypothetical protein
MTVSRTIRKDVRSGVRCGTLCAGQFVFLLLFCHRQCMASVGISPRMSSAVRSHDAASDSVLNHARACALTRSAGFHPAGCCICSPDCPEGFTDIGVSCQRPTYDRGVGAVITTCDAPLERDAALCYSACDDGFDGVGPGTGGLYFHTPGACFAWCGLPI